MTIEQRIERLERSARRWRWIAGVMAMGGLMAVGMGAGFKEESPNASGPDGILHVRGISIDDGCVKIGRHGMEIEDYDELAPDSKYLDGLSIGMATGPDSAGHRGPFISFYRRPVQNQTQVKTDRLITMSIDSFADPEILLGRADGSTIFGAPSAKPIPQFFQEIDKKRQAQAAKNSPAKNRRPAGDLPGSEHVPPPPPLPDPAMGR